MARGRGREGRKDCGLLCQPQSHLTIKQGTPAPRPWASTSPQLAIRLHSGRRAAGKQARVHLPLPIARVIAQAILPTTSSIKKTGSHETGPWCQKGWDCYLKGFRPFHPFSVCALAFPPQALAQSSTFPVFTGARLSLGHPPHVLFSPACFI